ncbi:hypothetical protein Taro_010949, partial [Colocasia esculenta]|nr:hypothetical protein [Colocasia esculenta]
MPASSRRRRRGFLPRKDPSSLPSCFLSLFQKWLPSAVLEGFLLPSQKASSHPFPLEVPSFLSEVVAYLSSRAKIHPSALTVLFVACFFTLFNSTANNVIKDRDSLKYRWRNIKKLYHIYEQLRTRSGWGWDDKRNLPIAPDEENIQAAIATNFEFKKYIDKPFPYKRQLDILCGKTTIRGSHFMGSTQEVDVEARRSFGDDDRPSVDVDVLVREIFCEENALFLAIDEAIADEILESNEEHSVLRPMHTSSHTGHIWINEVLQGHERRCYNMFKPHPTTFMRLRDEIMERDLIRDSRYVKATEKLAIFMYAMGHSVASGAMCEYFQHSSETISSREVTKALASLRFNYIKLPSLTDLVHPRIRHDDRFYSYFKDAIGAIDSTHIPAHILREKHARYRNRKGVISQNVMGVCGFDLVYQYVGVDFEGAAADLVVLRRAMDVGGFHVLE